MNIEEFANKMKQEAEALLGTEVWTGKIPRPNNGDYYAIGLMPSKEQPRVSESVNLAPFYEKYQATNDITAAASCIADRLRRAQFPRGLDTDDFFDPDKVRENIYFRLVNYNASKGFLKSVPHTRYLDLAKIYCIHSKMDGNGHGCAIISHAYLNGLPIREEELQALAAQNTPRLFPAYSIPMNTLIQTLLMENAGPSLEHGHDPSLEHAFSPAPGIPEPYVLTNTKKYHGAATICYENALAEVAARIGADFVVIPSSIHEVICQPFESQAHIPGLKHVLHSMIAELGDPTEILSDNIYLYKRATGKLTIA